MTRIIFIHQAISLVLFLSGLRLSSAGGINELDALIRRCAEFWAREVRLGTPSHNKCLSIDSARGL